MKNRLSYIFLCLTLSSCATWGQMDRGLEALSGIHIQNAFSVLGYPSGKQQFGNDTVYYWSTSQQTGMLLPQTSTTYGSVGSVPVYGTTTYNQYVPMNFNCLIKLVANSNDTVIQYEYQGNMGGCEPYIKRLNSYMK